MFSFQRVTDFFGIAHFSKVRSMENLGLYLLHASCIYIQLLQFCQIACFLNSYGCCLLLFPKYQMIANRKRLKIDFKLRKILPRNKTISENCTNRFLNQKYVDCNHEGTKNYTVPNFFRESFFCGMAQSTKIK